MKLDVGNSPSFINMDAPLQYKRYSLSVQKF